jgi:hypothetical protein
LKEEEDKENYRENPTPTTKLDQVPEQLQEICQEPTRCEVERDILRMKNNRVPGEDTVVAELIKYGAEGIVEAVQ